MAPDRDSRVVLAEAVGHLAFVATRRIYDDQPDLWRLGEHGRARTLEDFGHHFRRLATLDADVWAEHVRYCDDIWTRRDYPRRWLDDAWRYVVAVLRDEMPGPVAEQAIAVLSSVVDVPA